MFERRKAVKRSRIEGGTDGEERRGRRMSTERRTRSRVAARSSSSDGSLNSQVGLAAEDEGGK
jgi:hypothetical protein